MAVDAQPALAILDVRYGGQERARRGRIPRARDPGAFPVPVLGARRRRCSGGRPPSAPWVSSPKPVDLAKLVPAIRSALERAAELVAAGDAATPSCRHARRQSRAAGAHRHRHPRRAPQGELRRGRAHAPASAPRPRALPSTRWRWSSSSRRKASAVRPCKLAGRCPGGETGKRSGLKTRSRKACRFDSGPGHHLPSRAQLRWALDRRQERPLSGG